MRPRRIAPAFAAACLVIAVPAVSLAQAPTAPGAVRYFTNAENVRRIAAGRGHVAFATSGGVRVWDRTADVWRVYTKNDGLPTHNVCDVAFDPNQPATVWALCASWNDKPRRLYLAAIDLNAGTVRTLGSSEDVPLAREFVKHKYWPDYRLAVLADGSAVVAAGRDRGNDVLTRFRAGVWSAVSDPSEVNALPRPNAGAEELRTLSTDSVHALPSAVLVSGRGGFAVYDRAARAVRAYPFPKAQITAAAVLDGTTTALVNAFRTTDAPFDIQEEADGKFIFFLLERTYTPPRVREAPGQTDAPNAGRISPPSVSLLRVRFPSGFTRNGGYQVVSRKKLTEQEAKDTAKRAADERRERALLGGGQLTDVLEDGGFLWLATYNTPGRRATGVTHYDLKARSAVRPVAPPGGIAANMLFNLAAADGRVVAWTTNGPSLYAADRRTGREGFGPPTADSYRAVPGVRSLSFGGFSRSGGRRTDPEGKGRLLLALNDQPEDARQTWVRWTEGIPEDDPAVMRERMRSGAYKPTARVFRLGRADYAARKLETFEEAVPALADLRASSFYVQPATGRLFVLGADVASLPPPGAEQPPASVIVRWGEPPPALRLPEPVPPVMVVLDPKTGQGRRYPERRGQGVRLPPWYRAVEIRPFPGGLNGNVQFFEAAGAVWMYARRFREESLLFRYDAETGEWSAEGPLLRFFPYPDALFGVWGPRLSDEDRKRGRIETGELRRWTPGGGWERLASGAADEPVPLGTDGFLRETLPGGAGERYWIGGIGLSSLPASAARFEPVPAGRR